MNRFILRDAGLQRLNNQNKNVGSPIDIDSQQGELLLKLLDDSKQKDYELTNEPRMAADAVLAKFKDDYESEIASMHAEELAMQDGIVYTNNRAPELETLGLLEGGRALGKAEEILLNLDRLQGDVPAPRIKQNKDGSETRTHTQFSTNPVTGKEQIVGFMNPNQPDEVLKSELNTDKRKVLAVDNRGREEFQRGDEEVSENIMRLMGRQTIGRGNGGKGLSDLKAGGKNVDVMQIPSHTSSVLVPAWTALRNAGAGNASADMIARETESLVKAEMSKNGNNLMKAVDDLMNGGRFDDSFTPNQMLGKIGRSDAKRMASSDEVYDELIMPGYSKEVRSIDKDDPAAPANRAVAPDSVHMMDLHNALDHLNQGVNPASVEFRPNYGWDAKGQGRAQAKVRMNKNEQFNGQDLFEDVTVSYPMVQQILSREAMNKRKVPS